MSSPVAVFKLLSRKVPAVPSMHFPIVDVRDVAAAHLLAARVPEAVGRRFVLCAGSMWMLEIARMLASKFDPMGYNVPTHRLPTFLLKAVALFDGTVRMALKMVDKATLFDGSPASTVLGVTYRTLQESILSCAHSLVDVGVVPATKKYQRAAAVDP